MGIGRVKPMRPFWTLLEAGANGALFDPLSSEETTQLLKDPPKPQLPLFETCRFHGQNVSPSIQSAPDGSAIQCSIWKGIHKKR